jgi:hypothetical protein
MAERSELELYKHSLEELEADALPVVQEIATHTKKARKAMDQDPVDTLTLSNELVELSILVQRLGDRIARMGYIARGCKEFYERIREGHKVRLVRDDKIAAGVADSMKVDLSHEEFEMHNECEYLMDRLVYTRKSTDKTIDAIRSKLSYEKMNERNA